MKRGCVDGGGGHSPPYATVLVDFALLYPPYTWIPAFAGMTDRSAVWWAQPPLRTLPDGPGVERGL